MTLSSFRRLFTTRSRFSSPRSKTWAIFCACIAYVDEPPAILMLPKHLGETVDAVAREAEIGVYTPLEEALDYQVRGGLGHVLPLSERTGYGEAALVRADTRVA